MIDPVTNQLSNHAARRAADTRRASDRRARAAEKGEREEDSFDHQLEGIEQVGLVRPLSDAEGEESRIERDAHGIERPSDEAEGHEPSRESPGESPVAPRLPVPPQPSDASEPGNRLDLTA